MYVCRCRSERDRARLKINILPSVVLLPAFVRTGLKTLNILYLLAMEARTIHCLTASVQGKEEGGRVQHHHRRKSREGLPAYREDPFKPRFLCRIFFFCCLRPRTPAGVPMCSSTGCLKLRVANPSVLLTTNHSQGGGPVLHTVGDIR